MTSRFEHSKAKVVGFIPESLRGEFDRPLPIRDVDEQRAAYSTTWFPGEVPSVDRLHPDIAHLMPIVGLIINLGGLAILEDDQHLNFDVIQAPPHMIVGDLHIHRDGGNGNYRRAVVSNSSGTLYKTRTGGLKQTPDYGVLVIGRSAQHGPDSNPSPNIKTRLRVTRVDPFGK